MYRPSKTAPRNPAVFRPDVLRASKGRDIDIGDIGPRGLAVARAPPDPALGTEIFYNAEFNDVDAPQCSCGPNTYFCKERYCRRALVVRHNRFPPTANAVGGARGAERILDALLDAGKAQRRSSGAAGRYVHARDSLTHLRDIDAGRAFAVPARGGTFGFNVSARKKPSNTQSGYTPAVTIIHTRPGRTARAANAAERRTLAASAFNPSRLTRGDNFVVDANDPKLLAAMQESPRVCKLAVANKDAILKTAVLLEMVGAEKPQLQLSIAPRRTIIFELKARTDTVRKQPVIFFFAEHLFRSSALASRSYAPGPHSC